LTPPLRPAPPQSLRERARLTLQYLKYLPRTFGLVKESSRAFAAGMVALLAGQAALPAAMAWVGKLIVDAVVAAARSGDAAARWHVLRLVALEASLMAASTALSRGQSLLRDLMRASLGNHVNTMILEKAATLELRHFEDADFYDKMQNARREASIRPLSMALETASLLQQLLILASYAILLARSIGIGDQVPQSLSLYFDRLAARPAFLRAKRAQERAATLEGKSA